VKVVLFCHSIISDWNHGNAHFLRGVTAELLARGHEVRVFEPENSWSRANLVADHGPRALEDVRHAFDWLESTTYDLDSLDVRWATAEADLVIVHEWSDPRLVALLGERREEGGYRLLFHDTHHRAVTKPEEIARYRLDRYDGVLAFGSVIRDVYLERGWTERAWVWHEAADVRTFQPVTGVARRGDLVWVGNWGDGERSDELREFLLEPVRELRLSAALYGVRYPPEARAALAAAGIEYRGWLANHLAPAVFAAHAVTVHVPRRPYVQALPGIPTIRPFEAMACGIPLVSAPWDDVDGLFRQGRDYLLARTGAEMTSQIDEVLHDPVLAASLRRHGLETIRKRHTCAHRVDELEVICEEIGLGGLVRR
jgi:spore maturation protein CgeB